MGRPGVRGPVPVERQQSDAHKVTIESVTAMRNLHAAPADEGTQPETAAQGGAAAQTPHRDGAARPMPGNGNKRRA